MASSIYTPDQVVELRSKLKVWKDEGARQAKNILQGLLNSDIPVEVLKKTDLPRTVNTIAGLSLEDDPHSDKNAMISEAKKLVALYKKLYKGETVQP